MSEQTKTNLLFTELPEGTVTFLFTDIERSTELLKRLGDQYATLLTDQRHIVREAIANWHGQEVDTQRDTFIYRQTTAVRPQPVMGIAYLYNSKN